MCDAACLVERTFSTKRVHYGITTESLFATDVSLCEQGHCLLEH